MSWAKMFFDVDAFGVDIVEVRIQLPLRKWKGTAKERRRNSSERGKGKATEIRVRCSSARCMLHVADFAAE